MLLPRTLNTDSLSKKPKNPHIEAHIEPGKPQEDEPNCPQTNQGRIYNKTNETTIEGSFSPSPPPFPPSLSIQLI